MFVVGSSGITVGASGASQPAGTMHAVGPAQLPVCGAPRVAYLWPAIAWSHTLTGDRCADCVTRTRATERVPAQPTGGSPERSALLDR